MPSVVKSTGYTKIGRGDSQAKVVSQKARASASYYRHRPDHDHQREDRQAFNAGSDELEQSEVEQLTDEQTNGQMHRWVLSPPPEESEVWSEEQLRDWAREVMIETEGQHHGRWVGYVHEHEQHPHVHVIVYTDDHVRREDFEQMREIADESLERINERNYLHEPELEREAALEASQRQSELESSLEASQERGLHQ